MTIESRFWSKVSKADGCWEWTGCRVRGYGQFVLRTGKRVMAHRLSYELAHGRIPDGLVICHSCDNPACVNPDHLKVGSQRDNIKDAVGKGRNPRADGHGQSKLKSRDVIWIRDNIEHGCRTFGVRPLARKFGVDPATIRRAAFGKTWTKGLPDE